MGLTSLRAGLIAGAIGLILVLLYSLLYYRALGLLTALSLICSGAMVFAILVLLGRYINYTLDLAGIAGLIIGIGTTADSFVVFFERIKDEIREGRSFRSAVPRGWVRARKTIVSGNAVTFLAAAVLYFLAIGQVKGFAFTLGLTTILDLVVVFLVTWPLVYLASKSPTLAKPAYNGLGAVQQVARERRASASRRRDGGSAMASRPSRPAPGPSKTPTRPAPKALPRTRRRRCGRSHRSHRRHRGADRRRHGHRAAAPQLSARLYTGTGAFEVVGRRKLWYGISGAIVAVAILSHHPSRVHVRDRFQGRHHGVIARAAKARQVAQVQDVFRKTLGRDPESVVIVGNGSSATVQIRSETLSNDQTAKLRNALFDAFQPKGTDGKPSKQAISDSAVSETWGGQITKKALIALGVFLVLVSLYITVRYERYMAISALTTMCFDLTVTAGVYSLVGFEVTPATVIGLLTILGFSLYDTVIVFDKVEENTHGFQHTTRRTFAEQANLAINQTFMRSINTSLIWVLPVLALMVVAVWLLGVGTLKDLALVQLVGIIVGTYSSIFFATPLLVTLRERTELVRTHTRRVGRRRGPGSRAGCRREHRRRRKRIRRRRIAGGERRRQHRSCRAAGQGGEQAGSIEQAGAGCAAGAAHRYPASNRQAKRRPAVVEMASWCRRKLGDTGWRVGSQGVMRWTLAGLTATLTAPFALIACSGSAAAQIDYVVDGTLVTYNTNTVVGAASAGAQAFARTLTGFGYHGP